MTLKNIDSYGDSSVEADVSPFKSKQKVDEKADKVLDGTGDVDIQVMVDDLRKKRNEYLG